MSAPKEILVEYVEPARRQTGSFKVTSQDAAFPDYHREFPSLYELWTFLSHHDYRSHIGAGSRHWFGAPGVWRRV